MPQISAAVQEEWYMTNSKRSRTQTLRANFFRCIPAIILDAHLLEHILCDLYFQKAKAKAFMTDQEGRQQDREEEMSDASTTSPAKSTTRERRDLLRTYAIEALESLFIFGVFVGPQ